MGGAGCTSGGVSRSCPTQPAYDFRRSDDIGRAIIDAAPDMIIHLAAGSAVLARTGAPAEYFYDNVMMGVPLLHEAWLAGVSKFVAIGTVCAYPKFTPVPFREDDL